jgi:hypothetical protein
MDILKLRAVKENSELIELKRLAYKHYHYELEQYYFLKNIESPFKNYSSPLKKIDIDTILNNHIKYILMNKDRLNIKHDLLNNNPANLEQTTYNKLVLCSYYLSFCWYIPFAQLYNYFCYSSKENDKTCIDVFIGRIRKLYESDNEELFKLFEIEITEKYKNKT